jgi:hypothetical protein
VRLCVALALSATAILAGCGGSDDDALSREELIESANEICRERVSAIESLQEDLTDTPGENEEILADFARILPQVADEFRGMADDLGELSPPEDLEDQYELTLGRIDRVADELDRAAEEAEAGDRQGFNAVTRESAAARSIQQFFRENEFEACA